MVEMVAHRSEKFSLIVKIEQLGDDLRDENDGCYHDTCQG